MLTLHWSKFINRFKGLLTYEKGLIILIFALLFIVRITFSTTHIRLDQDSARDAFLMEKAYKNHETFIGYGPKASVGDFYLPPFYYQLHYFLSALTGFSPITMQFFTTVIEFLTVILVFKIFKYFFDIEISLFGALIYAFSQQVFLSSTTAWNPNMIPFFTSTLLFSFLKSYIDRQSKYILVACLSFTIAVQLHYQSVVLLPFLLIFFVVSLIKDKKNLKFWLLGGLLSLILFIPYLAAEYANHWRNTSAILDFLNYSNTHYFDKISKFNFLFIFFPIFIRDVLFGGGDLSYNIVFYNIARIIYFVGFPLLLLNTVKQRKFWVILVFFLTIFVMLRVYKGDKNTFYLSTLYLMPSFLAILIFDKLRILGYICVIIFLLFSFDKLNKISPINEYSEIQSAIKLIEEKVPSNEARFIFHNDDYINLFAYGLAEGHGFKVNDDSKNLIEVCDPEDPCDWNGELICKNNRGYEYSVLLKIKAGYKKQAMYSFRGYKILIGKLNKNAHFVGYDLYGYIPAVNDNLLPELYENRNMR